MPLEQGYSNKTISENIGREISSGKKPDQAAAIAYSVARKARREADDAELTYPQRVLQALQGEFEAIGITTNLIPFAPPEDIAQLVEITNDENDHAQIYAAILARYEMEGGAEAE